MSYNVVHISRTTASHSSIRRFTRLLDTNLANRYGEAQKNYDPFHYDQDLQTEVIAVDDDLAVGGECLDPLDHGAAEINWMPMVPESHSKGMSSSICFAKSIGIKITTS